MDTGSAAAGSAVMILQVVDGTRQPFSGGRLFASATSRANVVSDHFSDVPTFAMRFPFHDNLDDEYSVVVSAEGHHGPGFNPVVLTDQQPTEVPLMLLPNSNSFNFAGAKWSVLRQVRSNLADIFAADLKDENAAADRYSNLEDLQSGRVLACLLNITTAMDQLQLPGGSALSYLKAVNWELNGDFKMAQDRFFGWADPAILEILKTASKQKHTNIVSAPPGLHPGATVSYKQTQFGEANVQLTFHEGDRNEVNGLSCVRIEPDIDYFKDTAAHLIFEVAVNKVLGGITDPQQVYLLRWIAGQRAGLPDFDPLYTIISA